MMQSFWMFVWYLLQDISAALAVLAFFYWLSGASVPELEREYKNDWRAKL